MVAASPGGTCSNKLTLCWKEPVEIHPRDASGRELPESAKKNEFSKLLKKRGGRSRNAHFCARRNDCKPVYEADLTSIIRGIRTDRIDEPQHVESGGGDDEVSGIHVVQQVDFRYESQKKALLEDLGLPPDSGSD